MIHTVGQWLFFQLVPMSPAAIFGAVSVGWWAHALRDGVREAREEEKK